MSDVNYDMPEPPEAFDAPAPKKSNKTLWIILAVVAAVILCCCVVVVVGLVIAYNSGAFDSNDYYFIPGMLSLA